MTEIYFKRRVFWKDKKSDNVKYIVTSILIVLVIIFIFSSNNKNVERREEIYRYAKNAMRNIKIIFKKYRQYLVDNRYNQTKKTNNTKLSKTKRKTTHNKFFECLSYEKDYYLSLFQKNLQKILFWLCLKESDLYSSKEIESYYNFYFNKKPKKFTIENEYTEDIKIYSDDQICLTGGYSNLPLISEDIPKCLEFKNLQIKNFLFSKNRNMFDSNITINLHTFKIKHNKIHIYPISKFILNENIIGSYINLEYTDINEIETKNFFIYKSSTNYFIRICNENYFEILEKLNETKFWLEISWNYHIQNLLCFKDLNYYN